MQNWAGNFSYAAARVHFPQSLAEVQELVSRCQTVKALGTRHSFNEIADCSGDQISLKHLNRIVNLNRDSHRPTVTVQGGITYGELCRELHRAGYSLHNLASLPHITIAGACATATHGSGDGNRILASAIAAVEIVNTSGEIIEFSRERDGKEFNGAIVGLGALGMVTQLTLNLSPTFEMRQHVFENLPFENVRNHLAEIMSSAYSVSLFTDWRTSRFNQVWLKSRVTDQDVAALGSEFHGGTAATRNVHPIGDLSPVNCTEQLGVPGPWQERLPHFRTDYLASSGDELQSEYFVTREHGPAALDAINRMRESIAPLLQISELRTIAADSFWMSPFYQRDSFAIHFTWKPDSPGVRKVLPLIESALAPLDARPHWGKLFTMSREHLQGLYPKLDDFRHLVSRMDPGGKFRNSFLEKYVMLKGLKNV